MNGQISERTIRPCIRLGEMVRVHTQYLKHGKDSTRLIGFDCEQAKDCGMNQQFSADNWVFDHRDCPLLGILTYT